MPRPDPAKKIRAEIEATASRMGVGAQELLDQVGKGIAAMESIPVRMPLSMRRDIEDEVKKIRARGGRKSEAKMGYVIRSLIAEGLRARRQAALVLCALLSLAGAACQGQQVNWSTDPQWSKVPITFDVSAIPGTFDSSMSSAFDAWNFAAGCTVAAKASDPTTADVDVAPYDGTICASDAPNDLDTTPGATGGFARCSDTHGEIRFTVLSDIRSAFVEMEHELGHALGLAHDMSALMNPRPRLDDPAALGGGSTLLVLPSDADGAAVGGRYCR